MSEDLQDSLLTLTADIVSAHVGNNQVALNELPNLIANVHTALAGLNAPAEKPAEELTPAVSIRASVKPDYLVCLEDGKKLKMLRRYLMTNFGMTPDDYRTKWGLPADYPMVAPNYAATRSAMAKQFGLGVKGRGGGRKTKAGGKNA